MNKPIDGIEVLECLRMPEVLDEIFSKEIPGLSQDARNSLRVILGQIDNSGPGKGMTCVARSDIPRLESKIFQGVDQKFFEYDPGLVYQANLRAFMHRIDRACYECSRQDCENQVALTRNELLWHIFFMKSPGFRQIKTDLQYAGGALKPSYDY